MYKIKIKARTTKQGGRSVAEYANLLQSLWQELDYYRAVELQCNSCSARIKDFIEKDRCMISLQA